MKDLITITEYSKIAGITRDGVYKQIKKGSLPSGVKLVKIAGRNFIKIK